MDHTDPELFDLIDQEQTRQLSNINLIASENYTSENVLKASGSILTNKYAEGYPGKRYYAGCHIVDQIETLAINRAKELFGASYVNVQPLSGTHANMTVYMAVCHPGDRLMGLELNSGGHLTHGSKVSGSGILYESHQYTVDPTTGLLDYDKIQELVSIVKPKLLIAGGSAYSRDWDYKRFREIADSVGAILMADISHISGLVVSGLMNNPLPYAHIVTTTTHKTLRGPRSAIILMGQDFPNPKGIRTFDKSRVKMMSEHLDSMLFPGNAGGPHMSTIAAKAVAFKEAMSDDFKRYSQQIILNSTAMVKQFQAMGYKVVSDGTDCHLFLIDLSDKGISGKVAEKKLEEKGIVLNKNMIPGDRKSPFVTSGIRIGVQYMTTLGYKENDFIETAIKIDQILTKV